MCLNFVDCLYFNFFCDVLLIKKLAIFANAISTYVIDERSKNFVGYSAVLARHRSLPQSDTTADKLQRHARMRSRFITTLSCLAVESYHHLSHFVLWI